MVARESSQADPGLKQQKFRRVWLGFLLWLDTFRDEAETHTKDGKNPKQ